MIFSKPLSCERNNGNVAHVELSTFQWNLYRNWSFIHMSHVSVCIWCSRFLFYDFMIKVNSPTGTQVSIFNIIQYSTLKLWFFLFVFVDSFRQRFDFFFICSTEEWRNTYTTNDRYQTSRVVFASHSYRIYYEHRNVKNSYLTWFRTSLQSRKRM